MQKNIKQPRKIIKLLNFIDSHLLLILSLVLVFAASIYVRVYNTDKILGFYYDQGRDGLVIWKFIHEGRFFLVGPTTGIAGIFRGPWYYLLITPLYFIGQGNPVYPAIFLALTTVAAIGLMYIIANEIGGRSAAIISVLIASFSYYLIVASRWLSNPTPMFLISMIFVYSLLKIIKGNNIYWLVAALSAGMAMQFGSATEVFYFPVMLIVLLWQRHNLPSKKIIFSGICILLATFAPQILFDLRHGGLLFANIKKFLFEDKSFKANIGDMISQRFPFYYDVFTTKLFAGNKLYSMLSMLLVSSVIVLRFKRILSDRRVVLILLLLLSPIIGMLFFQGNFGNVYDYYFTGYYLIFVLLFSLIISRLTSKKAGMAVVVVFFICFFKDNLSPLGDYLAKGNSNVNLGNQRAILDWIYKDAGRDKFSVDVYVPPVVPYAYEYLFRWYSFKNNSPVPGSDNVNPFFTLYEEDSERPQSLTQRIESWDKISKVESQTKFGGITVQRRTKNAK